jgi:hypothetical protein
LGLRSLLSQRSGHFVVVAHGSLAPSVAEWNALLDTYRSLPSLSDARALVFTEGGAPNAAQRADLRAVFGSIDMPIAVITDSIIARAAGMAISWLNPSLRMFPPRDLDRGFEHIGATRADRRTLRAVADELRLGLGLGPSSGPPQPRVR